MDKILVVDDEPGICHSFKKILGRYDYDVLTASSGEEAMDLAGKELPDLVIMDINMPGMDGIQATQIIHKELPRIRIIGLSMFQEGEQQAAMHEAGAVNYLTKSGPSETLIDAIRASVRISEQIESD